VDDAFQIDDGDFVQALLADIFRAASLHVHPLAAGADGQSGEQLYRLLSGPLDALLMFFQNLVALIPQILGYQGFDLQYAPFAFRFVFPFPGSGLANAVEVIHAFGARAAENAANAHVAPLGSCACPMAHFIELPGNETLATVFEKKLVDQFADGGLLGIDDQVLVLPLVAIGRNAAQWLAEFGAGGNRCPYPISDFLSFPLSHRGNDREEQSPRWGTGVDGFGNGDEVGFVLPEKIGEFEEFLGIASQPRKLGENEAGDVAAFDVIEHPLGFRVILDALSTPSLHSGKIIHFLDLPAACQGIRTGTLQMMLGTFAFNLIFGGDANPDGNCFLGFCDWLRRSFGHGILSCGDVPLIPDRISQGKNKIAILDNFAIKNSWQKKTLMTEFDLAALAKKARLKAGKRKVAVAREFGVAPPSIFNAEEHPELPLNKLRIRMIETYSKYKVVGPVYYLERK